MKPKKLLVVGDFISGSGLTQFIFNMFPHFDTNKFNIQCVGYGIDPKDETKKKCEELGWQLDRVIPITKKPLHHIRWWKKFLKENHFDIIYFNYSSSWNYFPIQYAKRYTNAKIVCHSHNSYYSHVFSNRILMSILDGLNNRGKRIFNKDAPNITGIDKKNVKLAITLRSKPIAKPPIIVEPLLLVPGIIDNT